MFVQDSQKFLRIGCDWFDIDLFSIEIQIQCDGTGIELVLYNIKPLINQCPIIQIVSTVQFVTSFGCQVSNDSVGSCEITLTSFKNGQSWNGRQCSQISECFPRRIGNFDTKGGDDAFYFAVSVLEGDIGAVVQFWGMVHIVVISLIFI